MLGMERSALEILGPCPPNLKESTLNIRLPDGFTSKTRLIRPTSTTDKTQKCPLVIFYHGGGFTFCSPDMILSPARAFASYFNAVVACPSYKLAPENPFPAPVQSAWEACAWLSDPANLNNGPLKNENIEFDPKLGLVMAGTSAGANIAAVITGIAATAKTGELTRKLSDVTHPITGLFISLPYLLNLDMVPSEYSSSFRSREENANAPILSAEDVITMEKRLKPDWHSPLFSPLNLDLHSLRGQHASKVYIQCGDSDTLRDDGIIYERALQDSGIAETRIDIIKNLGHTGWVTLPNPECHSRDIREKSLDGMAWLLGKEWYRSQKLPY